MRHLRTCLGLAAAFAFCLSGGTLRAQNDAGDNFSNAVIEASTAAVSNAMAQISELAVTNGLGSNDVLQADESLVSTNETEDTNAPLPRSGDTQPGPSESRRQWLLRQRAGAPGTNQPRIAREAAPMNATTVASFRPVKPDFSAFKIINERNIFDPNRAPRRQSTRRSKPTTIESFALVGVMSYEKGTFAFFDGTSSDFRKAVKMSDSIAGYTVTNISPNLVKLVAGTNQVELRLGMQLRREDGGVWVPSSASETYAASTAPSASATTESGTGGADNDVLERLRKRREQE